MDRDERAAWRPGTPGSPNGSSATVSFSDTESEEGEEPIDLTQWMNASQPNCPEQVPTDTKDGGRLQIKEKSKAKNKKQKVFRPFS